MKIASAAAVAVLALGGVAITAPPAYAAGGHGSVTNVDGSGDPVLLKDSRPGPDRYRVLWPGGRSPAGFDVDRVSALCAGGKVSVSRFGPNWHYAAHYFPGRGHKKVYVRGC